MKTFEDNFVVWQRRCHEETGLDDTQDEGMDLTRGGRYGQEFDSGKY